MKEQKTIGILGGMGPEATVELFREIVRRTPARSEQEHLHIIIDNNPKIPSRTEAIAGKGADPVPMMAESGRALSAAGADFICIPCVTAHYFLPALLALLPVPVLSIVDETLRFIGVQRPRMDSAGLLGTSALLSTSLLQEALEHAGISAVFPDAAGQKRVQAAINAVKDHQEGRERSEAADDILRAARDLIKNGAGCIIAACTEIPLVLDESDISVPYFDTLKILAAAAVREAFPVDPPR